MATLESYGHEVHSIFQLLGDKENDITLSLSWALAKCPVFLTTIVSQISGYSPNADEVTIMNQKYDADTGITDIEITDQNNFHIIIEAKRGWTLPGIDQLTKYSLRDNFVKSRAAHKHIVSLSECTQVYALLYLPSVINAIPVSHVSWKDIFDAATSSQKQSNHQQKHLLDEFSEYLRRLMTMQKVDSNMVYVVSLGSAKPDGCSYTWIELVQMRNKYFCPIGKNGWPKEPPTYIAFRYTGKLQSIHHIEGYTVARNVHPDFPEMPNQDFDTDHFIYQLGPAIIPNKDVKTGNIYPSGRVWAMLDTLLTCDTISDARDLTHQRLN